MLYSTTTQLQISLFNPGNVREAGNLGGVEQFRHVVVKQPDIQQAHRVLGGTAAYLVTESKV